MGLEVSYSFELELIFFLPGIEVKQLAPIINKISVTIFRYEANAPVLTVEDGFQRSSGPEICLRDLLLVACFHSFLLHKIGGSETFEDKRTYFHNKLMVHHQKKSHKHTPLHIQISRFPSILKSSMSQTKSLSDQDWAKLFVIEFHGEAGIGIANKKIFFSITR